MIDHEIDGRKRVDGFGVTTEFLHGVAHRGKIHYGWNTGKVLHEHARGAEGYFAFGGFLRHPVTERAYVVSADAYIAFMAKEVFQQHLQGLGKAA